MPHCTGTEAAKNDMGSLGIAPFWHVNVPEHERTPECPGYLRGLNPKDLRGISTPDSDYKILTWAEVSDIVNSNNLALFQRIPSQLRRYKAFTYQLAKQHGTVANFILNERLRWTAPVTPRGKPFEYPEDVKILYNDWPYGLDSRIIHLVIWTKFELKAQGTGDLTDDARAEIEAFVTQMFRSKMPDGHVRIGFFFSFP